MSYSTDRRIDWTEYRREFKNTGSVEKAITALQEQGWTLDEAKQAKAEYDHRVEVARIEAAQQRARTAQACGYAITSEDAALINKGGQMIADVIRAGAKQGDSI